MKPDWSDAPEWANWFAQDADGEMGWFENEPELSRGIWARKGGRWLSIGYPRNYGATKISRPTTTKPAEAGSEGQGD